MNKITGFVNFKRNYSQENLLHFTKHVTGNEIESSVGKFFIEGNYVDSYQNNDAILIYCGKPFWQSKNHSQRLSPTAKEILEAFLEKDTDIFKRIYGDFQIVIVNIKKRELIIANDRFGIYPVFYQYTKDHIMFSTSLFDVITDKNATLSLQNTYNFFYDHGITGKNTIFDSIKKLEAANFLVYNESGIKTHKYWYPSFINSSKQSPAQLKEKFLTLLDKSVDYYQYGARSNIGGFLSGGLDSSIVCGMARKHNRSFEAFSIGFNAAGFDDMMFAEVISQFFYMKHHKYYLNPNMTLNLIEQVNNSFEQPIGSLATLPIFYGAMMAKENDINIILAGDGGNELFGGKQFYLQQMSYNKFYRLSRFSQWLLQKTIPKLPLNSIKAIKKAKTYIAEAGIPLPDRIEHYNLLELLNLDDIFEPQFLAEIDVRAPMRYRQRKFAKVKANNMLERILGLDFNLSLIDKTLPQVTRACAANGVMVKFPLLDPEIVQFACALPAKFKVNDKEMRSFYKFACKDKLPKEIIDKQKHAFGLPFGKWLSNDRRLKEFTVDNLNALKNLSFIRGDFIDDLTNNLIRKDPEHYGSLAWMMLSFQLWHNNINQVLVSRKNPVADAKAS